MFLLQVLLLLEGKAHAYVLASKGTKKWDTCAPEAVLRAVGGEMTDLTGSYYTYSKDAPHPNLKGILATAKLTDHSWYLQRVPKAILDVLK